MPRLSPSSLAGQGAGAAPGLPPKCDKNQEEDKSEINSAWPLRMSWYVRICISEVDPLLGWIHPCGPYCLPAARVQGRQSSTLLSPHHLPNILSLSSYIDQCFRDTIKVFLTDEQEEKRKSRWEDSKSLLPVSIHLDNRECKANYIFWKK